MSRRSGCSASFTRSEKTERDRETISLGGLSIMQQTHSVRQESAAVAKFSVGDHVSWNSEAGRVHGTISKVHKKDFQYKGHTHHASEDEPQYEIESDKTDHIAAHKESALTKLER